MFRSNVSIQRFLKKIDGWVGGIFQILFSDLCGGTFFPFSAVIDVQFLNWFISFSIIIQN